MCKKFILTIMSTCLILLALTSFCIYKIDPYYQFRIKDDNQIFLYDEVNQNPGLLKNFDYTTVITGSSMVENFNYKWFDEKFKTKAIKVPYSGAFSKNMQIVLDLAFSNKEKIDNVFLGLDIHMFINSPDETRFELPTYLYKDSPMQMSYLLNKNILKEAIEIVHKEGNLEKAYTWFETSEFSKENVLSQFQFKNDIDEIKSENFYDNIMHKNFDNIFPHIKEHPETNFYIFFPPYSILFWDSAYKNGDLNAYFKIEKEVIKTLSQFSNVEMFYFQDLGDVITDLNNYKDYTHYSQEINELMVNAFKNDDFRIDANNYETRLQNLNNMIEEYLNGDILL